MQNDNTYGVDFHQSIQPMKNKREQKQTREDKKRVKSEYNREALRNQKRGV